MYNVFLDEKLEIEEHQKRAIDGVKELIESSDNRKVALLYYSPGTGKTLTGVQIAKNHTDMGTFDFVLVIAPPSTQKSWETYLGKYVSVPFKVVSHQWIAKNSATVANMSRKTFLILDELHLSCNRGKPSTKAAEKFVYRASATILLSGTPFRNKEERLFTVQQWLFGDIKNYEMWLHEYCNTEPDRFSYYPNFISFKAGDIEEYLRSIDRYPYKKVYLEIRKMKYKTTNEYLPIVNPLYKILDNYSVYGTERITVANSVMRKLRYLSYLKYCDRIEAEDDSCVLYGARTDVRKILEKYAHRMPIVYSQSSKIAELYRNEFPGSLYIDGKTTKKNKEAILAQYKAGGKMIFATDSVSTGTDGLQETTDCIVVLYDTNDDTSRDQLIGRIAGGFRDKGNAEIVQVTIVDDF